MADVYQRPATITIASGGVDIIFSDPLPDIIANISLASEAQSLPPFQLAQALLVRINPADGNGVSPNLNMLGSNGLLLYPQTNGREMDNGDRFRIDTLGGNPLATAYVYTATGGEFAFAENTGNQKAAADLVSGEFFLNTVSWAETTDITAAGGFSAVVCAAGYVSDNDINCRLIAAADCGQSGRPDFWDGSMCVADCGTGFVNPANAGETCRDIAAADCGQNGRPDFWDGSMCVADCGTGFTNPANAGETCIAEVQPQTGNNTQTSGGESESKAAKVIGVVGIGMAIFVIANGGLFSDAFAFSPDFGYSLTESGYAINGGGKISYSADNLQMHWTANQTNANGEFGDFRYLSKAEYTADFWTATFSESVSGETADYNFALSANLQNGIWKISPVYRLHSEYEKGETETNNSLNLEGILQINRWTISPSAGFRWENADGFTENARFQINAMHRF